MSDLVNISIGDASVAALLGYCVVFFGLVLLMFVVMLMGKIMLNKKKKAESAPVATVEPIPEAPKAEPAPGSAGDLKLYNTEPRDAAMIMAIVADSLGKPLNELRFISIKEVTDE